MKRARNRKTYRTGLTAEFICRWLLRLKGYRIIAARYPSPLGEIDIIAARGDIVALIEVKARATLREANEALLPRQRQRLERAALDFLARHPRFHDRHLRFDLMLVARRAWPVHIPDAWRPER